MPACVCGEIAKSQQQISVKTETRRFGKVNTVISGFDDGVDIKGLAKKLKMKRACGGTCKNKIIELQGNHKNFIKPILVSEGFTEDQIADLVKQSAILAEITGKDLNEAVRGVTFAIGSGYFESLQRAGINISRAVVKNKALALGYEGVYNELEPLIRAQVTYNVIQKNLSALQDDAGRKIETFAGQILNVRRAWNDLLDTLGIVTSRSETLIDSLREVATVLDSVRNIIDSLSKLGIDPIEILVNLLKMDDNNHAARGL